MRNRLLVSDFLFDFYSNRGSIGTPYAFSNVSLTGLRKFRAKATKCRLCVYSHIWSPATEKVEHPEKQFSAVL